MVGDLGLLSDPVSDLNLGQYDFNFSVIEGCRPLTDEDCSDSSKGGDAVSGASSPDSSLLLGDVSLDTTGTAGLVGPAFSIDVGAGVIPAASSLFSSLLSGDESLDTAGVAGPGICGDVIGPPVTPSEDTLPVSGLSCDTRDPDFGGGLNLEEHIQ